MSPNAKRSTAANSMRSLLLVQKFQIGLSLNFKLPGTPLTDKPNGEYIERRREEGAGRGTAAEQNCWRKRRMEADDEEEEKEGWQSSSSGGRSGMTQMLTCSLSAFERADMCPNAQGQRSGEQEGQASYLLIASSRA